MAIRVDGAFPIVSLNGPVRGLGTFGSVQAYIEYESDEPDWRIWREGSESHNTIGAARDMLKAAGSRATFTNLPKSLGHGGYGYAFTTDNPNVVVKVTTDNEEAQAAQAIKSEHLTSGALPRIHEVWRVSFPNGHYYLIVREDLPDLPPNERRFWENCGRRTPCYVYSYGSATKPRAYRNDTDCTPSETAKRFGERIVKLCGRYGVYISDMHSQNLGVRASTGEIVIRDLGLSTYSKRERHPALLGGTRHNYIIGQYGVVSQMPLCAEYYEPTAHSPGVAIVVLYPMPGATAHAPVVECTVDLSKHALSCSLPSKEAQAYVRLTSRPKSGALTVPMCSPHTVIPEDIRRLVRVERVADRQIKLPFMLPRGISRIHKSVPLRKV